MLDPVQVGRANERINERADRVLHQRDRVAHPGVVDGSADQWRQTTGLAVSCRTTFEYTVACRQPSGELGQRGHFGYFARVFDRRPDGQAMRATTVLSALWPGRHVITDWRALSAAAALAGARDGWDQVPDPVEPEGTDPLQVKWDTYPWYRKAVLDCAAQEGLLPIQVERALYTLGDAMPGATWAAYASWIEERLGGMGTESGQ